MEIPSVSHPVWAALLTGQLACGLESLPIKFFLSRVKPALAKDRSPALLRQFATELRELFVANAQVPSVQRDLVKALQ